MEESVVNESKGHLSGIPFSIFTEIADKQKHQSVKVCLGEKTSLCCVCPQWVNHLTTITLWLSVPRVFKIMLADHMTFSVSIDGEFRNHFKCSRIMI